MMMVCHKELPGNTKHEIQSEPGESSFPFVCILLCLAWFWSSSSLSVSWRQTTTLLFVSVFGPAVGRAQRDNVVPVE